MILYMTLLCICFKYYLCSIGHLSSPKIMIIVYFSHRFPLTSHIRGHLLSTQMALLHPSADNSLCWYTKGHFRIEVCKTLYMGMTWDAFTIQPTCHFIFLCVDCRTWLYPLKLVYIHGYPCWQLAYCTRLFPLQPMYRSIHGFPLEKLSCHTWVASINSHIHIHSTLKNINHD